jgi:putative membrane protein
VHRAPCLKGKKRDFDHVLLLGNALVLVFFGVFLWMLFFSFMMPMRRTTYRQMQSPLQLLQKRYAAGEITSEDYEERQTKLLRDANTK